MSLLASWSENKIRDWLDNNKITVPKTLQDALFAKYPALVEVTTTVDAAKSQFTPGLFQPAKPSVPVVEVSVTSTPTSNL